MSTTHTTYNPREGSLADRVLAFFTQQPDEELSIEDIVPKFDAKVQSVKMCLKPSVQAGLIRWGQNEHGSWVYTAGPALQLKAERAREAAQQATQPAAAPAVAQQPAMSLRDEFAGLAMNGWIAGQPSIMGEKLDGSAEMAAVIARAAYTMADAMLKARQEGGAA